MKEANPHRIEVIFTAKLSLSEAEARALAQLFGYGVDEFLKAFYERLGRGYLEPHEHGIRSLAETIDREIRPQLWAVNASRRAIVEAIKTTCLSCSADGGRHYSGCSKAATDV